MGRDYHYHREFAGCSVTVGVVLGRVREVELLVNGHQAGLERVDGHHAQVCSLSTVLPTEPPQEVTVEVAVPGPLRGEPVCALVARGGERLPMPERTVPHRARPTEASWYG